MTRPALMAAIVAAFGSRKLAAAAIGCSPQMISHIKIGVFPMTDDLARTALVALKDHAEQLSQLAVALETELRTSPRPSRVAAHRNPVTGKFA